MTTQQPEGAAFWQQQFPHLSEEQAKEADDNFQKYLQVCLEIFENLEQDPERYARFKERIYRHSAPLEESDSSDSQPRLRL